jgi:hypothetical protein
MSDKIELFYAPTSDTGSENPNIRLSKQLVAG